MRWDRLFADLEAQWEASETADLAAEVSDRTRREAAALRLADRLRPARHGVVTVDVIGVGAVGGVLAALGPDWLLVTERGGGQALVPMSAVMSVGGLTARSAGPDAADRVGSRLGLGFAMRCLVRDRAAVEIWLTDRSSRFGTIDRVGADFLELAEHPRDEPRRARAVIGVRAIPISSVAAIRSTRVP